MRWDLLVQQGQMIDEFNNEISFILILLCRHMTKVIFEGKWVF